MHARTVAVGKPRLVNGGHALAEVIREIADGRELDVPRLLHSVEVGDLCDRPATENAEAEKAGVLLHEGGLWDAPEGRGN